MRLVFTRSKLLDLANRSGHCKAWPSSKAGDAMTVFRAGNCVGYVWGVAGALDGSSFCLSKGVQQRQVIDVVKRWLDDHPEVRHFAASCLVAEALKEKF